MEYPAAERHTTDYSVVDYTVGEDLSIRKKSIIKDTFALFRSMFYSAGFGVREITHLMKSPLRC